MRARSESYPRFLERLRGYERFEPLARSRGPEKLDGVRSLATALEHPERACRVVHVAGTNGKGTTAAMIARLLHRSGARTGLYTSPHVVDVRERITLHGAPIAEGTFAAAGHAVLDLADARRERIHFSYFDLLTLIALVSFRAERLEWAVLEVGLGGLSDATNIGPKELCVLTRIGLDHLHVLGDTLEAIAAQKLGIVTPGVPTVLAEQPPDLEPWLRARLAERNSAVHSAVEVSLRPRGGSPSSVEARWSAAAPLEVPLPAGAPAALTGPQLACAATALVAADRLPGRLELRRDQCVAGGASDPRSLDTVVLDGGHNPEALAALLAQLDAWGIGGCTLVLSLQRDKLVAPLEPPMRALLARTQRLITLPPQTERAPSAAELAAWLAPLRTAGASAPETLPDVRAALLAALETPRRPLVVTGSFWMLGDVMRLLRDAPAARAPSRAAAGATQP